MAKIYLHKHGDESNMIEITDEAIAITFNGKQDIYTKTQIRLIYIKEIRSLLAIYQPRREDSGL